MATVMRTRTNRKWIGRSGAIQHREQLRALMQETGLTPEDRRELWELYSARYPNARYDLINGDANAAISEQAYIQFCKLIERTKVSLAVEGNGKAASVPEFEKVGRWINPLATLAEVADDEQRARYITSCRERAESIQKRMDGLQSALNRVLTYEQMAQMGIVPRETDGGWIVQPMFGALPEPSSNLLEEGDGE